MERKTSATFSTVGDSLLTQPLEGSDASLLAVSNTGELAVALHGTHGAHLALQGGVLARTPLAGGSPREVLEDVRAADWDAKGELAVVHHAGDETESNIRLALLSIKVTAGSAISAFLQKLTRSRS